MDREIIEFVRDNEEGLMVIHDLDTAYQILLHLDQEGMEVMCIIARIREHCEASDLLERYLGRLSSGQVLEIITKSPMNWWESVSLCVGMVRVIKSRTDAARVLQAHINFRPHAIRDTGIGKLAPFLARA